MWEPLIITGLLASAATLIGIALYKRSESHIQYRWARFSGAAAIAVAAFMGMTSFYLKLSDRITLPNEQMMVDFQNAINDFDICLEHEQEFACREPAIKVRDVCSKLLDLQGLKNERIKK